MYRRMPTRARVETSLIAVGIALGVAGCSSAGGDESATSSKVVGGEYASIEDFPWQVSVRNTFQGEHFCGGSILSEHWVLTANHCVYPDQDPTSLRVMAGSSELNVPRDAQFRTVEKIVPYPGFVNTLYGKDAALLYFGAPLIFSSTVAPITMATDADRTAGLTDEGVIATVTGWGALRDGSELQPSTLRAVDVPIVSNERAASLYEQDITDDQLAAGDLVNGGKDTCQGDSGGPLTVKKGSTAILAGITSWGTGCALAKYPGMYGRVSSFEPWINCWLQQSRTNPQWQTDAEAICAP